MNLDFLLLIATVLFAVAGYFGFPTLATWLTRNRTRDVLVYRGDQLLGRVQINPGMSPQDFNHQINALEVADADDATFPGGPAVSSGG